MSTMLELSLAGQHAEAATIWASEIFNFHANPPTGLTTYDADGPVRKLKQVIQDGLAPNGKFKGAAIFHDNLTEVTKDHHIGLGYHFHHYQFDENNKLILPGYLIKGPIEREAPAFLYNPVSPTDPRFEDMKRMAMDFDIATARLDALIDATGWNREMVADLNLIRSFENWANRLVEEAKNEPKELPPFGQVDSKYWQQYTTRVAAPLAGLDI